MMFSMASGSTPCDQEHGLQGENRDLFQENGELAEDLAKRDQLITILENRIAELELMEVFAAEAKAAATGTLHDSRLRSSAHG